MPVMIQNSKIKLMCGGSKIVKMYCQGNVVYSSGNIVTYHVDTGSTYQEEVDEGESCLAPKTFTPAKSGWTFVGWRTDSAANGTVLSNLTMGDDPIILYAVFRQTVTVTYYNGSATASTTSGYRYYNNNNVVNPTFALTQAALSGWTVRGWSTSSTANASITYANGASFTRDSNITLYGMYQQTITLSYNGNGNTGGSTAAQTGTRYFSSINTLNPSFALRANGFAKTAYAFSKWALGSTSGTQYAAGASVTLSANTTMYAVWTYTGAPFYIVQNYACKQTLAWTQTAATNCTIKVQNFTAGSNIYATVGSTKTDDTQVAHLWASSGSIQTKGNKTLTIRANLSSAGGTVTVNGVTKTAESQQDISFDISGLSSVIIGIYVGSWAYTSEPYMQFQTIYLS